MLTIWAFDYLENKHTLYCDEDCVKKICSSLRQHATNIPNFEKKKMLTLTKKELKLHEDAAGYYICGKRILKNLKNLKNYWKFRDHCHYAGKHREAVQSICNLKFNVPNEIPVVFHNGSNYDYQFIIKEYEFAGKFKCLGENTEKYKTFLVPKEKVITKIDKNGYRQCCNYILLNKIY